MRISRHSFVERYGALFLLLVVGACVDAAQDNSPHPANLVGRWVRLRPDMTWGDTMEFVADGALRGSAGYPTPPNLRWEIRRDSSGGAQYCALQIKAGFCRTYRLAGDTLEMIGGPQGHTTFRRVR